MSDDSPHCITIQYTMWNNRHDENQCHCNAGNFTLNACGNGKCACQSQNSRQICVCMAVAVHKQRSGHQRTVQTLVQERRRKLHGSLLSVVQVADPPWPEGIQRPLCSLEFRLCHPYSNHEKCRHTF